MLCRFDRNRGSCVDAITRSPILCSPKVRSTSPSRTSGQSSTSARSPTSATAARRNTAASQVRTTYARTDASTACRTARGRRSPGCPTGSPSRPPLHHGADPLPYPPCGLRLVVPDRGQDRQHFSTRPSAVRSKTKSADQTAFGACGRTSGCRSATGTFFRRRRFTCSRASA